MRCLSHIGLLLVSLVFVQMPSDAVCFDSYLYPSTFAFSDSSARMKVETTITDNTEPEQESGVPFRCTRIINGQFAPYTRWYTMSIRSGKLLHARNDSILCESTDAVTRSHLWCFTGTKEEGYQVYNCAFGPRFAARVLSSDDHSLVQMSLLSTFAEGTSLFQVSENGSSGYNLHHPDVPNSCWNDYGLHDYVALWNSDHSPYDGGSCIVFSPFDPTQVVQESVMDSTAWQTVEGEIVYLSMKDGSVNAFPKEYIVKQSQKDDVVSILAVDGKEYVYEGVDNVLGQAPAELPTITSFKFNNKYNDMLMEDAIGVFVDPSHIRVDVGSIGKRLAASIKTSVEGAEIYVADSLQDSKHTSRRFEQPVTYTVALPGWRMLRRNSVTGEYGMHPFGNDYQVQVTYLCDYTQSAYGVPTIYITTDNGTMISSKDYYWDAKITIDGAGYLPDMVETPMQIKGRGNSSWAGATGKSPYRIKFASKQKPLGMKAGKNWNLIANAQKGSMTTNVIGSRVAEMVGAAAANHFLPAELYINGEYRGSYTLTEKVGFSNNSIDLLDESNAVLLELDSYYDETYKFKTSFYNIPVNVKYPDFSTDVTNLTLSSVSKHFTSFTRSLMLRQNLWDYVDPVYLARYLMVNDLIFNLELTHPKSTFLYHENLLSDTVRYIFGPVWDCDWGFGYQASGNYFTVNAETDFFNAPAAASTGKDFLKALRYNGDEEIDKQYYRVWTDFVQNHLEELLEYLDDYYAVAANSFEHDNERWQNGGSSSYAAITKRSKEWLRKRSNYVYDYLSNTLGYADKGYLLPDEPDGVDIVYSGSPQMSVMGIYDLSGRRVGESLENLPAGIYIQNGKKIVKR